MEQVSELILLPTTTLVSPEAEQQTKGGYFQALRFNGICLPSFGTFLGLVIIAFFPTFLFGMGMSILCLFHHCSSKVQNLSGFTNSQLEEIFASGPQVSLISD